MDVRYNQLGNSELKVSEIGLGCMSFKREREVDAHYMIDYALDQGVNLLDTADLYEKGGNEQLVGKALKGRREQVIVATKVGNVWREDAQGWSWDPSKKHILHAVKESLRRLQLDYIDLYQLHGGTLEDPIDETIDSFETLRQEGLIRYYGISSIRPNVIREYLTKSNIVSVMSQYSMLDRRPEEETFECIREHGVGVIGRGPISQGLLSTHWREKKKPQGYLTYTADELQQVIADLEQLVPEGYTLAQLAIRYALTHPSLTCVVPGASQLEQLKEIIGAKDMPELDDTLLTKITSITKANKYEQHR